MRLSTDTPRRGDAVLVTLWDGKVLSTRIKRVVLIPRYAVSNLPQRIELAPRRWYALEHVPGLVTVGTLGIRRIKRVPS